MRETSGDAVKLYTWYPVSTNSFFHYFSEDKYPQAEAEATRTGQPVLDVAYEVGLLLVNRPWLCADPKMRRTR